MLEVDEMKYLLVYYFEFSVFPNCKFAVIAAKSYKRESDTIVY